MRIEKVQEAHSGPIEFLLSRSRISSHGLPNLMHADRAKYLPTFHLFPPGGTLADPYYFYLVIHSLRSERKHSIFLLFSPPHPPHPQSSSRPLLFPLRRLLPLFVSSASGKTIDVLLFRRVSPFREPHVGAIIDNR